MAWRVPDLSDYLVAVGKNGGPVGEHNKRQHHTYTHPALMRDERKVLLYGKHTSGKPKIQVFTSSGRLIATLNVSVRRYA